MRTVGILTTVIAAAALIAGAAKAVAADGVVRRFKSLGHQVVLVVWYARR